MVRPVDAGKVIVAEAVPLPVRANAYPPEAVRSRTVRLAVDGETVSLSASTVAVMAVLVVVAAAAVPADAGQPRCSAAPLRRAVPSIKASDASAGVVGAPPDNAPDSEASRLWTVVSTELPAICGEATVTTTGCGSGWGMNEGAGSSAADAGTTGAAIGSDSTGNVSGWVCGWAIRASGSWTWVGASAAKGAKGVVSAGRD
jgi:hypothetical protein